MQTKELRLALVCYGGVSLAVYMHGLTKEVWKLARASMRRHSPAGLPPARDSEIVYQALLDSLPNLDLRVMCDIVAGASAGGINGVLLARALVEGHDLDAIRSLWLDGADSDVLLDRKAASRPLSKLWAIPLVWWVRRRGLEDEDKAEVAAHGEVKRKLSRFMRSRWFKPPFSGAAFSGLLTDAFAAMEKGERTPPLVPRLHPFDLFVTVTDYHGAPQRLRLNTPEEVTEPEHRLVIGFACPGDGAERHLGPTPDLVFAARATASFPGAFPPARISEIDALLASRGEDWPGRQAFIDRVLPGRANPESVDLIDGAVLDNRPFGPALAALGKRPAHREVDRRFVYLDPKPGMHDDGAVTGQPPGFFGTILRSLADIPRQQPIRDSLGTIEAISMRSRRLRHIVIGMMPQVDIAIDSAIGMRLLLFSPSLERLAAWRRRMNSEAAKATGFAYGAYGRLKFALVTERLAERIAALGGQEVGAVRVSLWRHLNAGGVNKPETALGEAGAASGYVLFLRNFDVDFRIRRLRFLIRRVNMELTGADEATAAALGKVKAGLYAILAPHLMCWPTAGSLAAAGNAIADPASALAAVASALDLKGLDGRSDAELVALLASGLPRRLRRDLVAAYLGFPFFDIAILPLIADGNIDELDEIKVDRISPEDCSALTSAGGQRLKGALFNAFGAFFSRAYREHDYLWGRLHGAERLIDLVVSSLPAKARPDAATLGEIRRAAFRAIVAAERAHLVDIPDTIAALDAALAE
ncbi:patatin-like protein [Sandarakinorhabdus limnophila]|uniref:patatin-like protein n=1 Tax=Sandarakinorhabdus limnophila TaxID=210512 RepID=UPI0026EA3ECC|nr:patatin-like protein [Sandarakinorhabdus limnophila]